MSEHAGVGVMAAMSSLPYRIGRFSASRPWVVVGAWATMAVIVVVAAGTVGSELEDSFAVPGLDSQVAANCSPTPGPTRRA